jgi:hypothetical protein
MVWRVIPSAKPKDILRHCVGDNVHIITGIGGKGMTGSGGFTKENAKFFNT